MDPARSRWALYLVDFMVYLVYNDDEETAEVQ